VSDEPSRLIEESGRQAAWIFAREATADLARATQQWLADENWSEAARLAQEHANKASTFQAGHAFEFVETLKFNAASAQAGELLRAATTASQGQSTAAADIIISLGDLPAREVQAKLYADAAGALRALDESKYDGMQRLVAADKVEGVRELLGRRLAMNPDGIHIAGYEDVERNLTGELHHGGVGSGGTTRLEATLAAEDPLRWLHGQSVGAMVNETLTTAAIGAAAGAVFTGAAQSLRLGLAARRGELGITEAIVEIATTSATAAVWSGTSSGLAKVVEIGARNTRLLSPLAETTAPIAVASAVVSTGQAAYDYALGRIGRDELIDRCGEVALRNTSAWAFGVVGQTVVPIPLVGALVGSTVGYVTSAVVLEGLKLARIAAANADDALARLTVIETEVMVAIKRLEECRLALEATIADEAELFESAILPSMDRLEAALTHGRATDGIDALAALNLELGAKLDWATLPEFDAFMADTVRPLQL
jgi:hypothetical protein